MAVFEVRGLVVVVLTRSLIELRALGLLLRLFLSPI